MRNRKKTILAASAFSFSAKTFQIGFHCVWRGVSFYSYEKFASLCWTTWCEDRNGFSFLEFIVRERVPPRMLHFKMGCLETMEPFEFKEVDLGVFGGLFYIQIFLYPPGLTLDINVLLCCFSVSIVKFSAQKSLYCDSHIIIQSSHWTCWIFQCSYLVILFGFLSHLLLSHHIMQVFFSIE